MDLSINLFKVFNILFPFADFTYILQQEEYSSKRLVRWLPRFFFRRNFQNREQLKLTQHAKAIILGASLLWLASLIIVDLLATQPLGRALITISWVIFIPFFVLLSNLLTNPYFDWVKDNIRKTAQVRVKSLQKLKVITIAGSYGKTTTKNFIQQLVQSSYRTQMVPGNINTPTGIAGWLNKNLQPGTELLIMEVDAYEIGEIARSCQIAPADIAVLTNIGDQHLERFGNKGNLAIALAEVFNYAKPQANCICDLETKSQIRIRSDLKVVEPPIGLTYQNQAIPAPQISESNITNLRFAIYVAEILNIPAKFVSDTVIKLQLPERRQRKTEMFGFTTIDDSYNISFITAQAGISAAKLLAQQENKKLLVITAGIPELGPMDLDKNIKLGEILNSSVDHTVILNSMFAKAIKSGMANTSKYTVLPDLETFIQDTKNQYKPEEWILLIQPELTDLYY